MGRRPRASQNLILGAKCHALLQGKFSPDIEDVNAVANAVLQHRIVLNYKAEAENIRPKQIIQQLMNKSTMNTNMNMKMYFHSAMMKKRCPQ
jgi:MoxR-like ATPases